MRGIHLSKQKKKKYLPDWRSGGALGVSCRDLHRLLSGVLLLRRVEGVGRIRRRHPGGVYRCEER